MLVNMTTQLTTTRQERGQTIAQHNGQIKRIDDYIYTVKFNREMAITLLQRLMMNGFANAPITLTEM